MVRDGDINKYPDKDFETFLAESDSSIGSGTANTLEDLEKVVNSMLSTLPRLNRAALRIEMENMAVELKQSPTTDDLSQGLAFAQGYKDRLSEIYMMALREHKIRQRAGELLLDAYNVISNGKSADKRRGEAIMKYSMMLIHMEAAETFLKEVEHIIQNVKSTMEAISRQVSIIQLQLQLGEVRKSGNASSNGSQAEEFIPVNYSTNNVASKKPTGTTLTPNGGSGPVETDWSDF